MKPGMPRPPRRICDQVKQVADVIRRHGGRQELWVAEIGYSDYVEPNGRRLILGFALGRRTKRRVYSKQ